MSRLKSTLREIHRRFVWQAFAIYLVFAWIAIGVVAALIETRNLPDELIFLAAILLVIGLPIVLVTAYVQRGIPALGRSVPTIEADPSDRDPVVGAQSSGADVSRLFTWRNAVLGGVAAFTIWALVAVAWLILADRIVDDVHEPGAEQATESEAR